MKHSWLERFPNFELFDNPTSRNSLHLYPNRYKMKLS